MTRTILAVVAAFFLTVAYAPRATASPDSLPEEFSALRQQAKKAGGAANLADGQHQRLLELKYMLGNGKGERPLPLGEARELARLEISAQKSGGLARLSDDQYKRLLTLRIMKGDTYSQPLPAAEAGELAALQAEARKLGGESRLPTGARERLKALRCKVCQGESANPFF